MIPTCEPCLTEEDRWAVDAALRAGHVALGPEVEAFEQAVAHRTGFPHAVATSSGSAALIVAVQAITEGRRMRLTIPTLTFAAAAEAIVHAGSEPEFVDHGQPAFLSVNFYGHPPSHPGHVQDACEGLGSSLGGQIACLSFNGNKIITAGQGGMVLTRDAGLAQRVRDLIDHAGKDATWSHAGVGWNFRMAAVNAALGLSQIGRLDAHLASKRDTWREYASGVAAMGQSLVEASPGLHSAYWMPLVLLDRPARPVIDALITYGIGARAVWTPLHRQTPYQGYRATRTPVADDLWQRGLLLPCSVGITPRERELVLVRLRAALDRGRAGSAPAS